MINGLLQGDDSGHAQTVLLSDFEDKENGTMTTEIGDIRQGVSRCSNWTYLKVDSSVYEGDTWWSGRPSMCVTNLRIGTFPGKGRTAAREDFFPGEACRGREGATALIHLSTLPHMYRPLLSPQLVHKALQSEPFVRYLLTTALFWLEAFACSISAMVKALTRSMRKQKTLHQKAWCKKHLNEAS